MLKVKNLNYLLPSSLLLISSLLYGCATGVKSKKITVASAGKIESLDPARANTLKSLQLLSSMGDTLYELDREGKLKPKLAEALPYFSHDNLKIFIKLKENIFYCLCFKRYTIWSVTIITWKKYWVVKTYTTNVL